MNVQIIKEGSLIASLNPRNFAPNLQVSGTSCGVSNTYIMTERNEDQVSCIKLFTLLWWSLNTPTYVHTHLTTLWNHRLTALLTYHTTTSSRMHATSVKTLLPRTYITEVIQVRAATNTTINADKIHCKSEKARYPLKFDKHGSPPFKITWGQAGSWQE